MVNVQPFGSYANGLSLAASDIDVVITGVTYPDDGRGGALSNIMLLFFSHFVSSVTSVADIYYRLCRLLLYFACCSCSSVWKVLRLLRLGLCCTAVL